MNDIAAVLLTVIAIFITAKFILEKYNPMFVFFTSGIIIFLLLAVWKGFTSMGEETTGNIILDIFAYIGIVTKSQLSGVGTNLMIVAGYAAFMTYIKASDKLASVLTKPLMKISNPYIVLGLLYVVGTILKMMITSHAGLVMLLMATAYPILVGLGIGKLSAAAAILATGSIDWGPNDGAAIFAAENVVGVSVVDYFMNYQWIPGAISVLTIATIMVVYFRKLDKKNNANTAIEVSTIEEKGKGIPRIYAILPSLPLLLVIGFSLFTTIEMDVFTASVISLIVVFILEIIIKKDSKEVGKSIAIVFKAMGNSFANVVTLIIAAGVFSSGLIELGGINILANTLAGLEGAQLLSVIALSALTFFAVIILGSGNASWFAFGPLVPDIASKVGLQPYQIAVPMQLASGIGRGLSPVAGAVIAVAGLAEVDTDDLIKRNIVPLVCGAIVNIIVSYVIFILF